MLEINVFYLHLQNGIIGVMVFVEILNQILDKIIGTIMAKKNGHFVGWQKMLVIVVLILGIESIVVRLVMLIKNHFWQKLLWIEIKLKFFKINYIMMNLYLKMIVGFGNAIFLR